MGSLIILKVLCKFERKESIDPKAGFIDRKPVLIVRKNPLKKIWLDKEQQIVENSVSFQSNIL
jgi:hypothetical protein